MRASTSSASWLLGDGRASGCSRRSGPTPTRIEAAILDRFEPEVIERHGLRTGTAHSAQGSERDSSSSRSGLSRRRSGRWRFVEDPNLFNVLITRPGTGITSSPRCRPKACRAGSSATTSATPSSRRPARLKRRRLIPGSRRSRRSWSATASMPGSATPWVAGTSTSAPARVRVPSPSTAPCTSTVPPPTSPATGRCAGPAGPSSTRTAPGGTATPPAAAVELSGALRDQG